MCFSIMRLYVLFHYEVVHVCGFFSVMRLCVLESPSAIKEV